MTNAPAPWTSAVLAVLPSLTDEALWGRKALLAPVAAEFGLTPVELARLLLDEQRKLPSPTLSLSRADIPKAVGVERTLASEVDLDGAIVHFVALA